MIPADATSPVPDRALMCGLLALQLDFIGREDLVVGLTAWQQTPAESFNDVLVRVGAIDDDRAAVLNRLADHYIDGHGRDVRRALAAAAANGFPEELGFLLAGSGADLFARLTQVGIDAPTLHSEIAVVGGGSTLVDRPVNRYHIRRPLARGAVGQIHVADDTALRREVALKEIRASLADDPISRERFLLEAEITGGLEHPGIVPVHSFGTHADGRPFYTMRLVKGETLVRAIERYYTAEGRMDRRPRRLAFRDLIARFVAVCNTVAYAHARGVVHRDLKPGNVMLGPFGETLVMDWGLARATGIPLGIAAGELPLVTATGELLESAMEYQAIGTPGYMSPEQATGRSDVGPASDIYSLGATLYVILTGRLPFVGTIAEVLEQTHRGDPRPARRIDRTVSADLSAVAQKAMARQPEDRYSSALALADDVAGWLAGEPVTARKEPTISRWLRWSRRNRTLATITLVALTVLSLALMVRQAMLAP